MGAGQRLSLVIAVAVLPASQAVAQTTLPWPTENPRPAAPAPWPGAGAPSAAPAMGAVVPPRPSQGSPFDGGGMPPCMVEFGKLRDDVQKRGLAAKAAGERKVSREEMCKHITAYSAAELKWVKYSETNVTTCGIPSEVVQQLKQVHGHTEQTKEKICAAGPSAGPPSLSEALGTSRQPTPDTAKSGSGTFDTLTGSPFQR